MVKAPCFQCREHEFTWGSKIPMPHGMAKTAPPKSSILLTVKKNEVVQFSRSVLSDSLWLHELQHARLPHPSPTPRACSNSCPSSQRYHPIISSSVVPFSSCLQSSPASESFPMSQFFASGSQRIGVSASASVLPMTIQDMNSMKRQKESYQAMP